MGTDILIPESVRDYLYDGSVRRAINQLLSTPSDAILEGLDWPELDRFYRAQLAARQFEAEWSIFALEVWNLIWGGLFEGWEPLTPDAQMDEFGAQLNVSGHVEVGGIPPLFFYRVFTKAGSTFWGGVEGYPEQGLRVMWSWSLTRADPRYKDLAPTPNKDRNWVPTVPVVLEDPTADLSALRALAQNAIALTNETLDGARNTSKVP